MKMLHRLSFVGSHKSGPARGKDNATLWKTWWLVAFVVVLLAVVSVAGGSPVPWKWLFLWLLWSLLGLQLFEMDVGVVGSPTAWKWFSNYPRLISNRRLTASDQRVATDQEPDLKTKNGMQVQQCEWFGGGCRQLQPNDPQRQTHPSAQIWFRMPLSTTANGFAKAKLCQCSGTLGTRQMLSDISRQHLKTPQAEVTCPTRREPPCECGHHFDSTIPAVSLRMPSAFCLRMILPAPKIDDGDWSPRTEDSQVPPKENWLHGHHSFRLGVRHAHTQPPADALLVLMFLFCLVVCFCVFVVVVVVVVVVVFACSWLLLPLSFPFKNCDTWIHPSAETPLLKSSQEDIKSAVVVVRVGPPIAWNDWCCRVASVGGSPIAWKWSWLLLLLLLLRLSRVLLWSLCQLSLGLIPTREDGCAFGMPERVLGYICGKCVCVCVLPPGLWCRSPYWVPVANLRIGCQTRGSII